MHRRILAGLICLAACSCGSGGNTESTLNSAVGSGAYPQLEEELERAFSRLGIDPRTVSEAVAGGAGNTVFDLSVQPGPGDPPQTITLSWTERNIGDYDLNGVVNISDLTPLGQNLGKSVDYKSQGAVAKYPAGDPDAAGSANWRLAAVDGNSDGLVSIADVTPIAQHWEQGIDGYIIERAVNNGSGSLDWQAVDLGGGVQPSLQRSDNSQQTGGPVRFHVELPLEQHELTQYWRVRAWDSRSQQQGEKSNSVNFTLALADTAPPIWDDAVGVTSVGVGSGQATVHFGTATDEESPPVGYTVYWDEVDSQNPEAPLDFGKASSMDVPQEQAELTVQGLANEQPYRFAVRAHDSAETSNEEHNTVSMVAVPNEGDVYPPEWQGEPGIQDLYYGNGYVTIRMNRATDNTESPSGTWASNPVRYRIYYGEGSEPDWENAETREFSDNGEDFMFYYFYGLDTSVTRWFAVRCLDSAIPSNEDGNEAYIVGYGTEFQTVDAPGPGPDVPKTQVVEDYGFVFSPDQSQHRYLVASQAGTECWISSWELLDDGYVLKDDLMIGTVPAGNGFKLKSAALDENGNLLALYPLDAAFLEYDSFAEYSQADNQTVEHREDAPLEFLYMGHTFAGDPFVVAVELVESETIPYRFQIFYSTLPFNRDTMIYDMEDKGAAYIPVLDNSMHAALKGGNLVFLMEEEYPAGGDATLAVTISDNEFSKEMVNGPPGFNRTKIYSRGFVLPVYVEELRPEKEKYEYRIWQGNQETLIHHYYADVFARNNFPEVLDTGNFYYRLDMSTRMLYPQQGDQFNFDIEVMSADNHIAKIVNEPGFEPHGLVDILKPGIFVFKTSTQHIIVRFTD